MENKIISIDISPENTDEITENAGVMWEHNATSIVFSIDPAYVGDYKYYLEYRSIIGTKVRTQYLGLNTEDNTVTYNIPVTMSSLRGVECYFNIVKLDDDGQTVQVIKPKKFFLEFDYSPDTDNSISKVNDFSINALLEAIRLGTFKGEPGDAIVNADDKMSSTSTNPVQNKVILAYIDSVVNNATTYVNAQDREYYRTTLIEVATALKEYIKKENVDTVVTENSKNPISGGAVYEALQNVEAGATDNKLCSFIQNTDIDYAYDSATNANYTIVRIYKNRIDGTRQYPFVYAPNGVNAGTKSTYDLVESDNWLFAINAGIFDTENCTPDGIVIQNGIVVQSGETATHPECKPLTIDSEGNLGYAEYDANAEALVENGIISAVTGFMPIIVDYEPVDSSEWNDVDHYTENAQRQIIGQFGNGDYAIITCEGRNFDNSDGWTIAEAQTICQKHGLKFAYNLDGGGSTETMLGYKHINTVYEGTTGRKVPTFIVFNGASVFDGNEPSETEAYTDLEYMNIDGQYVNTGIAETEVFTTEYKALNNLLETDVDSGGNTKGHIMSSANSYIPFIKQHPQAFENDSYADARILTTKTKGTEKESVVDIDTAVPHIVKGVYDGTVISTYIDDVHIYDSEIGSTALAGNTYTLFAYGGNPTAAKYQLNGKFYYLKLYDIGNNLVHYFKPVRRNADNTYGILDEITQVFYESASSISFS